MQIRRTAAAAFAAAITSTSVLAATTVAAEARPDVPSAATSAASVHAKGCVTKAEYRKAKKGMAQSKVHKIFGTSGKVATRDDLPNGQKLEARGYKTCTKGGAVGVSYVKKRGGSYKLAAKAADWG